MKEILTITLNPAVDKSYTLDRLTPEHKLRCPNPKVDPGGGGINVAKALVQLGESPLACLFVGGRNGSLLLDMLRKIRLDCLPIEISGETRESIVIGESSTGKEFRIVVDGPEIPDDAYKKLIEKIKQEKPRIVIASGSIPKGLPPDVYADIAREVKSIGSKIIIDTSGDALKAALEEGVFLVKPNLKELSSLVGVNTLELDDVDEAAKELINKGKAEIVVVSLSSSGAMLVTKDGYEHIPAPTVEHKSTVGAGDSMVAGMTWAIRQNFNYYDMVCWGIACGTAATMHEGTELFKKDEAEKLYRWIKSHK